ncbi:Leucine carboxyl methyltransferase 1 [Amphibalanus amphitrite]|uniref:Leucine carboxyl methyltransferase 1 n=1 Tax=Amphibalanus amphitrite TaxID=1232801 RepID=A0A6A4WKG4_AMPAM|nr:Leucine carboxyl methyltransferase 1 [Amphibalanus amphitrite]
MAARSEGTIGQEGIILTNDDASVCKLSAVRHGYWQDPFISHLVRQYERKAPEIHRGYYARVMAVQRLTEAFLARCGADAQVLNLGAGFDTLYWRLKSAGCRFSNFVELDFSAVTARKLMAIQRQKGLMTAFKSDEGEVRVGRAALHAEDYHLAPVDLARLADVRTALEECCLRPDRPTIVLAECVLVYMESRACHELLSHLASTLRTAYLVNYEMVGVDDRFGQILVQNVRGRGCDLAGIEACNSDQTQMQRFTGAGWDDAKVWRMDVVLRRLPSADVRRMERLELLDEMDILLQLLEHYGITVAWRDPDGLGLGELDYT